MKNTYKSKTIIINILFIALIIVQSGFSKTIINPESQVLIIASINLLLRFVTNKPIIDFNKLKEIFAKSKDTEITEITKNIINKLRENNFINDASAEEAINLLIDKP